MTLLFTALSTSAEPPYNGRLHVIDVIVRDLRKKRKNLQPHAIDGWAAPVRLFSHEELKAQEGLLQNIINDLAYQANQLRSLQRKLAGKRR